MEITVAVRFHQVPEYFLFLYGLTLESAHKIVLILVQQMANGTAPIS